jgi:hypothetical protein
MSRQRLKEVSADATLKLLIQHLVLSFPQAAVFSRQVGERYNVVVIASYDGSPDKAIQVERAWLADQFASMDEFRAVLELLNLPTVLQRSEWVDLRSASGNNPAQKGWAVMEPGSTVTHGPFYPFDPSLARPYL